MRRSEGLTPAAIARTVEAAAMAAFRQATETGDVVHITTEQLIKAIKERGGTDRPTVEAVDVGSARSAGGRQTRA